MVGEIVNVVPNGGMVALFIKGDDGAVKRVLADNGPAIRAFHAAFGDVILPGHRFNPDALKGKRIEYQTDDLGMMTSFEPA